MGHPDPGFYCGHCYFTLSYRGCSSKFKTMYDHVYAKTGLEPTAISRFVMENYQGIYYSLLFVTLIGLSFSVISHKNQVLNIAIASFCNIALWLFITIAFFAVWHIHLSAQYAT